MSYCKSADSDDWSDGIAGKSLINKSREGNPLTAVQNDSNEILDETRFIHPIKQIQGTYLEQFINGSMMFLDGV